MNIKKYILPIYVHFEYGHNDVRPSFIGNGFIVNDYFITAYHIIAQNQNIELQSNPYIVINKAEFELTIEKSHSFKSTPCDKDGNAIEHEDKDNGDFIAYKIDGIRSPLQLAEHNPKYGEAIDCCFFHNVNPSIDIMNVSKKKSRLYYWETKGIVMGANGFTGNFFGAIFTTCHPTGGGSSGSPLFKDNIVYGILHGGNPNVDGEEHPEICAFYAASAARTVISQKTT
jgi:hypothetical protein